MLDDNLWLEISCAARESDVSKLKFFLAQRPSRETLNHGDPSMDGITHLHMAATQGNPEVVKLLIDAGANVHATIKDGRMPLHLAASRSCFDAAKLLVEAGANVNAKSANGKTPRQLAVETGYLRMIEMLNEAPGIQRAAWRKAEEEALLRQNAEQQAERARLQVETDARNAVQRQISELQVTLAAKQREIDQLRAQNNARTEAEAKQTAAELQHRCEQLEQKLQSSEAAFAEKQLKLEQVEEQNKELTAQVARLQAETAQTKAELAAARPSSTSTVAELQRRLDRTLIHLEIAREERDEMTIKNAELRKQIQALESTTPSSSTTCTTKLE